MARYACSDLHGRLDLANRVIARLQPEDHLYFLGDAIDRGPQSFATLVLLLNHPQVTFLMGNHEDMMVKAMLGERTDEVSIDRYRYFRYEVEQIWFQNGGYDTAERLADLRERDPEEFYSMMNRVSNLRFREVITNALQETVVLCHAGFQPGHMHPESSRQLWDREHLRYRWPRENTFATTVIVHGHTPIQTVMSYQEEDVPYYRYAEGHKIDIDLGAFFSGQTCLLNLDTWEGTLIEGDHIYDT